MRELRFFAAGVPRPQPRAKSGRTRSGRHVTYDPGTADEWKASIMIAAMRVRECEPIAEACEVEATFVFPRPLRMSGVGRRPHVVRPDRDNLEKALLDALVQCRVLVDDSVVCGGEVRKVVAGVGEAPGVEVVVRVLEAG